MAEMHFGDAAKKYLNTPMVALFILFFFFSSLSLSFLNSVVHTFHQNNML